MSTPTEDALLALISELNQKIETLTASKPKAAAAITTGAAITELIASKVRSNRRRVYIKSLKYYLDRFAVRFPHLGDVTAEDVQNYIDTAKANYSKQTNLFRISTLFSFAVRRGWVEKNPCDKVERITVDRIGVKILTVEQSRQLLAT